MVIYEQNVDRHVHVQHTFSNVSATSNWPVLSRCKAMVRSKAVTEDGEEKRSE
jgi:hypothetical protein